MIYDVAIVGAGPAGSSLAALLARDGHSVALLDKEEFPREKVCGGGISNKTVGLLDVDITPVVERTIRGAYLTYCNRDTVVRDLGERSGVTVTRRGFDALLLRHAMSQGARFFASTRFLDVTSRNGLNELSTSRGAFRTRLLVGADGVFSQVRARVFGANLVRYAPALEALVSVEPAAIERFSERILLDFGSMPRGYGWIFPKRDHLNVGVFSIYGSRQLKVELHSFLQRYDTLRAFRKITYMGSAIPIENRGNLVERGAVMLVGDAAGFAESFYGEGIYFALKSAMLAHRAITVSGAEPGSYAALVRGELAAELRYSRLNAHLFFPRQKFGFYRMVRNVHVNEYFAELIGGNVGHRECFYRTILTSPYWLWSRKYPPVSATF